MTREEAIMIASEWDLDYEVNELIEHGATPEEALAEWDLL